MTGKQLYFMGYISSQALRMRFGGISIGFERRNRSTGRARDFLAKLRRIGAAGRAGASGIVGLN
jgi:hypothetical protein